MKKDFLTALLNSENLRTVYDRLSTELDTAWRAEKDALRRDLELADHIQFSLREPVDSVPYRWALSFLQEAKAQEEQKTPERRKFEKNRREIEEAYLAAKAEETERIKARIRAREEKERTESTAPSVETTGALIKRRV